MSESDVMATERIHGPEGSVPGGSKAMTAS
jgi:hypothetical protein